jgi:hypothetical protein
MAGRETSFCFWMAPSISRSFALDPLPTTLASAASATSYSLRSWASLFSAASRSAGVNASTSSLPADEVRLMVSSITLD